MRHGGKAVIIALNLSPPLNLSTYGISPVASWRGFGYGAPLLMERWPSGLRRAPGKRVGVNAPRGFESPSLRHIPVLSYHFLCCLIRFGGGFLLFNPLWLITNT